MQPFSINHYLALRIQVVKNNTITHFRPGICQGLLAISPVVIFLLLYVVVSLVIRDFYSMPVVTALFVASVWSIAFFRGNYGVHQRIEVFSKAAANPNILFMIWIFVLAGAFASLAKNTGAIDSIVRATLGIFPVELLLPGLFIAACLISISIGTSVGTIVALAPLGVSLAETTESNVALFVGVILGGAFFGDNLSFISDTTIASTRTQGCSMSDKFKANIRIALPAALITIVILYFMSPDCHYELPADEGNLWLMLPYLLVIVLSVIGVNVAVVLTVGIAAAFVLGLTAGFTPIELCQFIGHGIDSMGDLTLITLLAAGMLGVVKHQGGIDFILDGMKSIVRGPRGCQWCIAMLTGIVNLCTANNTVAIITVGPMVRDMAETYGVDPRKSASLLDTSSCIVQCLIPYGAQTLLATSLAGISPIAPFAYLYYPWILAGMVAIAIVFNIPSFKSDNKA